MENPDRDAFTEQGNERLMLNYALYVMDHLEDSEKDQFLLDTNLYMTVEKVEYFSGDSTEAEVTVEFSNMPEDVEPTEVLKNLYVSPTKYYNCDSLAHALNAYYHDSTGSHMKPVLIGGYVFDVNTGLFYYNTMMGYFKADYVYVSEGGKSYDYRLTVKNGKEVYYNSYYDKMLDTSKYVQWDWVQLSVKKMGITSEYSGAMLQLVTDSSIITQQLNTMNYFVENYYVYYASDTVPCYQISMALSEPLTKPDLFMEYASLVNTIYQYQNMVTTILIASILLLIISIVLLAVSAPQQVEALSFFHRVPLLIFTAGTAAIEILLAMGIKLFVEYVGMRKNWEVTLTAFVSPIIILIAVMVFVAFVYLANVITRIRTKTIFRYTLLYYISRPIVYLWKMARENLSLFWKGLAVLVGITIIEIFIVNLNQYDPGHLYLLLALEKIILLPLIAGVLVQMQKLREGAKRVASGEINQQINVEGMYGVFKDHAIDINRVTEGIVVAVEEQMKSERFKTELITNVSHDIKTPLTSIINYVDLIKKEDITDETMLEYVDVLDRQSARLKKLIEDLMEASKASTGNLEVNLEECDMGVLLTQLVGEFEDKLSANGLEVVVTKPEEPVLIMADGRHIWRVLDNLMNNVCKYSQENTRVYVTLDNTEEVHIIFKNISKTALNISSEQLMQRFVRGDSSRHTEGSGLGLSIAQSLTELMNGHLKLDIDGDLFKVTLTFNRIA